MLKMKMKLRIILKKYLKLVLRNDNEIKEFLENYIDYNRSILNGYFDCKRKIRVDDIIEFLRKIFQVLCELLTCYLSLEDETLQPSR